MGAVNLSVCISFFVKVTLNFRNLRTGNVIDVTADCGRFEEHNNDRRQKINTDGRTRRVRIVIIKIVTPKNPKMAKRRI